MFQLHLPDMTCGHCRERVAQAIRLVDPQARFEVDLVGRRVRIDGAAEPARFSAALAAAGYPPSA